MSKKRKNLSHEEYIANLEKEEICPLCQRLIPKHQKDEHHLIPKSKKGKETVTIHRVCHRQIHALFTEKELAKNYHSIDKLLTHEEMQKFISWVKTKPNDFLPSVKASKKIKR